MRWRRMLTAFVAMAVIASGCSGGSGITPTGTPTFAEGEAIAFVKRILNGTWCANFRKPEFSDRWAEAYLGEGIWEVTVSSRYYFFEGERTIFGPGSYGEYLPTPSVAFRTGNITFRVYEITQTVEEKSYLPGWEGLSCFETGLSSTEANEKRAASAWGSQLVE